MVLNRYRAPLRGFQVKDGGCQGLGLAGLRVIEDMRAQALFHHSAIAPHDDFVGQSAVQLQAMAEWRCRLHVRSVGYLYSQQRAMLLGAVNVGISEAARGHQPGNRNLDRHGDIVGND